MRNLFTVAELGDLLLQAANSNLILENVSLSQLAELENSYATVI
jgi:hypothetical protein